MGKLADSCSDGVKMLRRANEPASRRLKRSDLMMMALCNGRCREMVTKLVFTFIKKTALIIDYLVDIHIYMHILHKTVMQAR